MQTRKKKKESQKGLKYTLDSGKSVSSLNLDWAAFWISPRKGNIVMVVWSLWRWICLIIRQRMLKRRIRVLFWNALSLSWELFGRWQSLKVRLSDFFVDVLFWKISYSCFSSCHFAFAENQEEPFDLFVLIYGFHRCFLNRRIVKLKIICVWSQERGMSQPCDSDCARFYLHLLAISHRKSLNRVGQSETAR